MKSVLLALLLAGSSYALACADTKSGTSNCDTDAKSLEQQRMTARVRLQALAAVGLPGSFVCRKLQVGISEHDWIRGYVVDATDEKLRVRITDAGQFPHQFDGTDLVAGAVIESTIENWVPCIPN